MPRSFFPFFFFNDTATTEIYTLSLHDALPISRGTTVIVCGQGGCLERVITDYGPIAGTQRIIDLYTPDLDRKSTRLNSSHVRISYAVFCLKKKTRKIAYSLMRSTSTSP